MHLQQIVLEVPYETVAGHGRVHKGSILASSKAMNNG